MAHTKVTYGEADPKRAAKLEALTQRVVDIFIPPDCSDAEREEGVSDLKSFLFSTLAMFIVEQDLAVDDTINTLREAVLYVGKKKLESLRASCQCPACRIGRN